MLDPGGAGDPPIETGTRPKVKAKSNRQKKKEK